MGKKEKEIEIIPNLRGDLLVLVREYDKGRDLLNDMKEKQEKLKKRIIETSKKEGITKARSQLFTFSWKMIKQTKLATNKLKEILIAKGQEDIVKECEYDINFPQIYIKKRKGGENIF